MSVDGEPMVGWIIEYIERLVGGWMDKAVNRRVFGK